MKFGMFTSGYQRLPLEKCFTDAAQLGYDYIELWGGYPHAFAPDVIEDYREIRRLQEHYGIPVPVYTPEHNAYPYNYMLGTEKQWRNCMAYLEVSVRAAGLIGAGQMLISVGHGGECPAELRRARLRRSVEHLARAAEREHVVLLLETLSPLESNTCTRLHELKELLEAVDSPWLMGMCDVVPPVLQGEDPVDYCRHLGSRMAHLHLVDCDGVTETHLIPGDGVLNLKQIVSDFRQAGYDGRAMGIPVAFDGAERPLDEAGRIALPHVNVAFFSDDASDEESLKARILEIAALGPQIVVATRGGKGSLAYDGESFYPGQIVPCSVVDTMGAGDSFIAGFLMAWLKKESIPACMRAGAENAAVTLGYPGAW